MADATQALLEALIENQRELLTKMAAMESEHRDAIARLSLLVESTAPRAAQNAKEAALKQQIAAAMHGHTFRPGDAFKDPLLRSSLGEMGIDNAVQFGKRLARWCEDFDAQQPVEKVGRSKYRMPQISNSDHGQNLPQSR